MLYSICRCRKHSDLEVDSNLTIVVLVLGVADHNDHQTHHNQIQADRKHCSLLGFKVLPSYYKTCILREAKKKGHVNITHPFFLLDSANVLND